jgi:hypothetical protein
MCSYNRYAFNDEYLPKWFTDDERVNFRPQLPVDKETIDRIKDQFRDIAARPIKKVCLCWAVLRCGLLLLLLLLLWWWSVCPGPLMPSLSLSHSLPHLLVVRLLHYRSLRLERARRCAR